MARTSSSRRRTLLVLAATTAVVPAAAQERPPEATREARTAAPAQERPSEPRAEAQGTPSVRAIHRVKLVIDELPPGAEVQVVPRAERAPDGAVPASCTQACELDLHRGAYTLIATRGDAQRTKDVDLMSPQLLTVGASDGAVRVLGTVLGVTGIAVGALGAFIIVASAVTPGPGPDDDEVSGARMTVVLLGVLGLGAGTGLALGGFSLASGNRAPSMELEPMQTTYRAPRGPGAGMSLSGKF